MARAGDRGQRRREAVGMSGRQQLFGVRARARTAQLSLRGGRSPERTARTFDRSPESLPADECTRLKLTHRSRLHEP